MNFKIANIKPDGYAALAPMAGVTDGAFRALCSSFSAGFTVSEMVSSKGVDMNDKKSKELMLIDDAQRPCGIQLFGSEPLTMARAAYDALEFSPDFIDINMGCPVPKVALSGAGSALMKDPPLASEIVRAVTSAVQLPVTVKIRSGWDSESINAVSFAKLLEQSGAAAIAIHARTRAQMYAPSADWNIIRQVKNAVSVPVIGNGDIACAADAARMYEETNCDFVMVGRAALGAPWIFSQINACLGSGSIIPDPPVSERMRVMMKHIKMICDVKGEYLGMLQARKHAAWYMKGIRGASSFRNRACRLQTLDDMYRLAYEVTEREPVNN